jgi:hypothetical protein
MEEKSVVSNSPARQAAAQEKTHIVAFKEMNERYATPELYLCSAEEADAIEELLGKVLDEGDGPISTVSDRDFVELIETITLAELQDRFADELAKLEAEAEEDETDAPEESQRQ